MVVNRVCCFGIWQKLLWVPKQFGNCFLIRWSFHPWAGSAWLYCHQLTLVLCHSSDFLLLRKPSARKVMSIPKHWQAGSESFSEKRMGEEHCQGKGDGWFGSKGSLGTGMCGFGAPAPGVARETHRPWEKTFLAGTCTFLYTLGFY